MKNICLGIILFACLLGACKRENVTKEPKSFPISATQKMLINAGNEFSFDLIKAIHQEEDADKNLFFSPFSISMALGMTLNGATGKTYEDMKSSLHLTSMSLSDINTSYKYLIDNLKPLDKDVVFTIANSIWYRQGYTIVPEFISNNQDYFYAQVNPLDFAKSEESKVTINNWVKDKTNGKIEEIIDNIKPEDFMFLINALYFNGQWTYKFEKSDTREMDFNLRNGDKVITPFMFSKMNVKHVSNDLADAIELPYGEGNFSMIVLVPQYNKNLDDLIEGFNSTNWNYWISNLNLVEGMSVYLPKFTFDYEIELKDILSSLGMSVAFSDMADFSGINADLPLYISKVKHKGFVSVNEEGTEAAAVTSVGISFTSISQFAANKPFLFVIKERNTQSILFVGKVMKPVL
ncbi:serpin family protein [Bacteroidota bacterium]